VRAGGDEDEASPSGPIARLPIKCTLTMAAAQTAMAPFRVGLKEIYLYDIPQQTDRENPINSEY